MASLGLDSELTQFPWRQRAVFPERHSPESGLGFLLGLWAFDLHEPGKVCMGFRPLMSTCRLLPHSCPGSHGPQHPGYPACRHNSPGMVEFSDSHHSMTHWLHGGNFPSGWRDHTFILCLCNPRALSVISPNKGLKISEEYDLACVITTLSFLVLLWFCFF